MLVTTFKNGKIRLRWKWLNLNFMCGVDKQKLNFVLLISEP